MGPQPLLLNGYQGSFPEVKWPGHEADHSTPSSEEFKKEMSYTYTPPSHYAMHTDFIYLYLHRKSILMFTYKYLRDPQRCIKACQEVIYPGFNLLQKDVIQNSRIN
jgi:hypothetical protein